MTSLRIERLEPLTIFAGASRDSWCPGPDSRALHDGDKRSMLIATGGTHATR